MTSPTQRTSGCETSMVPTFLSPCRMWRYPSFFQNERNVPVPDHSGLLPWPTSRTSLLLMSRTLMTGSSSYPVIVRREGMMITRATASLVESGDHFDTTTCPSGVVATWSVQSSGSDVAGIDSQARSSGSRPFEGSLDRARAGEPQATEATATKTAAHVTRHAQPFLTSTERAPAPCVVVLTGVMARSPRVVTCARPERAHVVRSIFFMGAQWATRRSRTTSRRGVLNHQSRRGPFDWDHSAGPVTCGSDRLSDGRIVTCSDGLSRDVPRPGHRHRTRCPRRGRGRARGGCFWCLEEANTTRTRELRQLGVKRTTNTMAQRRGSGTAAARRGLS